MWCRASAMLLLEWKSGVELEEGGGSRGGPGGADGDFGRSLRLGSDDTGCLLEGTTRMEDRKMEGRSESALIIV